MKLLKYLLILLMLVSCVAWTPPPAPPGPDPDVNDINILAQIQTPAQTTDEMLAEIGQNYSFVLTSQPDPSFTTKLRNENPDIPIYLFANPFFFWEPRPEWHLKDALGNVITYEGFPIYDTRIEAYQDYFASQMLGVTLYGQLDGVFLDTMEEVLPGFISPEPAGYDPTAWTASQYQFLNKVIAALPNHKIYSNSSTRGPGGSLPIPNQGMRDLTWGQSIEAFSIFLPMDTDAWTKYWYLIETTLNDVALLSNKDILIEARGDASNLESRLYALASFLLVQNEHTFFYFRNTPDETTLVWQPEWDAAIGDPLGAYQSDHVHGNFFRDFTNGKVLVNPLGFPITVPTTGYMNWDGTPVGDPITMPAQSGRILVTQP